MTLTAGDKAPDFTLLDDTGASVSLADFAGERLVLYFYPRAFTPGCTTQACDLRDNHEALAAKGYAVAGVSPDSPEKLADFRTEHNLPFPMLSDPDHAVSTAFGAYGEKMLYGKTVTGMIRSTFIIGPDGVVEEAWRNVKAKGHADRLLKRLD